MSNENETRASVGTIERVAMEGAAAETVGPTSAKRQRELAAFRDPPKVDVGVVLADFEQWERDERVQPLNPTQKRFALEYAYDSNIRQAAIKAGYTQNYAMTNAYRLAKDPRVAALVRFHQRHIAAARNVTAERVVGELAKIGFANISAFGSWDEHGHFIMRPSSEIPEEVLAAVEQVDSETVTETARDGTVVTTHKTRLKLHPKSKALENLGRVLGMFSDNINITQRKEVQHLHALDTKTLATIKGLIESGKKKPETSEVVDVEFTETVRSKPPGEAT
jgi:phage terminase small subunit